MSRLTGRDPSPTVAFEEPNQAGAAEAAERPEDVLEFEVERARGLTPDYLTEFRSYRTLTPRTRAILVDATTADREEILCYAHWLVIGGEDLYDATSHAVNIFQSVRGLEYEGVPTQRHQHHVQLERTLSRDAAPWGVHHYSAGRVERVLARISGATVRAPHPGMRVLVVCIGPLHGGVHRAVCLREGPAGLFRLTTLPQQDNLGGAGSYPQRNHPLFSWLHVLGACYTDPAATRVTGFVMYDAHQPDHREAGFVCVEGGATSLLRPAAFFNEPPAPAGGDSERDG